MSGFLFASDKHPGRCGSCILFICYMLVSYLYYYLLRLVSLLLLLCVVRVQHVCFWQGICRFSADWMEDGLPGRLLSFLPGGLSRLGSNIRCVGVHAGSVCHVFCRSIMYLFIIYTYYLFYSLYYYL